MKAHVAAFQSQLWAMEPARLLSLLDKIAGAALPPRADLDDPSDGAGKPDPGPGYELVDGVAVINVAGLILRDVPWWLEYFGIEATSTVALQEALAAAVEDSAVRSILLFIASPGGSVDGVAELADELMAAREAKPLSAYIADLGASAAYWLASQAQDVSAGQTAVVGSIGVYSIVEDTSKLYEDAGIHVHLIRSGPLKGVGADGVPISAEELEPTQRAVNAIHETFVQAVARGRGLDVAKARAAATGEYWIGAAAEALGLVDRIENFSQALARVGRGSTQSQKGDRNMGKDTDSAITADQVQRETMDRLEQLEAAFPQHREFARAAWRKGQSVAEAKVEHYEVLQKELIEARAETAAVIEGQADKVAALEKERDAARAELETVKAGLAVAGHKALDGAPPDSGDAVAAYKAKVAELVKAGDKAPERTIATKFPAIQEAYLAAVNAGPATS